MIERLDNIKLAPNGDESTVYGLVCRKLQAEPAYFRILKKSLDARNKRDVHWLYSVEYSASEVAAKPPVERCEGNRKIVVVGSGPAGLFCALRLTERGFRPIVVERGGCVEERARTVRSYAEGGELDENCNVQFGEGGAGTFSDGKLNTATHRGYNRDVLETFVRFGAPQEVAYLNKPHIGSDRLPTVVANLRKEILARGGEFRFRTLCENITVANGKVRGCLLRNPESGVATEECADAVVLAVGHSARDTFARLRDLGIVMERRPFAVGVRIEHSREKIDRAQYGAFAPLLPAADYKAVSHAGERSVFTFCMCPGGVVLPSESERESIVTNGMSNYARDGVNSNSGLLAQIEPSDFASEDVLAGMEFQRNIERAAYRLGGKGGKAPVQLLGDFLHGRVSDRFGDVKPTYARGTAFAPLGELFPPPVTRSLQAAIPDIGKRLHGFDDPSAVLTGAETRFSSPIRIVRGESGESVGTEGLYPCGEGCGYSGGIASSAADGMRIADLIFEKFK